MKTEILPTSTLMTIYTARPSIPQIIGGTSQEHYRGLTRYDIILKDNSRKRPLSRGRKRKVAQRLCEELLNDASTV